MLLKNKSDIIYLLQLDGYSQKELFREAEKVKKKYVKNRVYFRGLIEFSNICMKDCYYCGIRNGNTKTVRYNLDDDEILAAVLYAHEQKYASVVLQSGEVINKTFINRMDRLLKKIHQRTNNELHIIYASEESGKTFIYAQELSTGRRQHLASNNRKITQLDFGDNDFEIVYKDENGEGYLVSIDKSF